MTSNMSNAPVNNALYTTANGTTQSDVFFTFFADRDPTTNDINFPVNKRWINTTSGEEWILTGYVGNSGINTATWLQISQGSAQDIISLSDNDGNLAYPSLDTDVPPNNIQIAGEIGEKNGTPFSTTTAGTNSITINPMATARLIVDQNAGNGTNTTIMGAMALARSGDTIFILPGTYTENVDMLSGVALAAYSSDGINGNVVILGRVRLAGNGTCSFAGLQLKTNGNYAIELTGNATMNFVDCNIVANDFTAIHVNNAVGQINLDQCIGGNAGNNPFFAVDLGVLEVSDSFIGNSSSSATAICTCAGTFNCFTTHFDYSVTTSGTGSVNYYFSRFHTAGFNGVGLTLVGTGGATIEECVFQTGSGVAVTVGAGCNCNFQNNVVDSTAANAITGAGAINYANNSFVNNSNIATTTQSPNTLRYGYARSTLQPSFLYTADSQINVTGNGVTAVVSFAHMVFDQGNPGGFVFNGTDFSAPVDGNYLFNVCITVSNLTVANTRIMVDLVAASGRYQISNINAGVVFETNTGDKRLTVTGSVIVPMTNGGTTVHVAVTVFGGAQDISVFNEIFGALNTFISGHLVS